MILRPAAESGTGRLAPLLVPDPASVLTAAIYDARRLDGQYRPEWTWIAEEAAGGPLLAAAVWWGFPAQSWPDALDGLFTSCHLVDADRVSIAAGLLTAAHEAFARAGAVRPPEYHVFLPSGWRDRADTAAALNWRQQAARRAGLTGSLERLRYEWTARSGLPELAGGLRFRAEPDDEVFAGLFERVLTGTLDSTSRRGADANGAPAQARQDVAFYRDKMLGERSWWRIAETPAGDIAGFGVPSRNADFAVVGYLGVLPEHRGHHYAAEILADITRVLAGQAEATVIRADTDLANRPMAAAFERAGYRNFGCRLVLSAP